MSFGILRLGQRRTSCSILFAIMTAADAFSLSPMFLQRNGIHNSCSNPRLQKRSLVLSYQVSLAEDIRRAFEEEQTDGILKLSKDIGPNVDELIPATMEAAAENRGQVASILNSFIGACSLMEDKSVATSRVCDLLEAYEELEEDNGIHLDIVTYALAYNALSLDPDANGLAELVLERAKKMSKKMAGSKRRKALAASRRKKQSTSCTSVETELKGLLGEDFKVLYETDSFFVINKPSGVSCFHKKTTTAGKIKKGKVKKSSGFSADISLEDALLACNVPLSTLNPEGLGLVHRIDRGSSGCMVLAKNEQTHANLLSEFFLRKSGKKYLTIVAPAPDTSVPDEGHIDISVDSRPAKSKYQILERYGSIAAFLQFDIYTGRKHQVRLHAIHGLKTPVLFDSLYASKEEKPELPEALSILENDRSQFFLHASRLSIPEYGIEVEAPIPSWWEPVIKLLKEKE
jgi:23S rRNA-/tRNA-specific pseudouridylate synthase